MNRRRYAWMKLIGALSFVAALALTAAPSAFAGALPDIQCSLYLTSTPPAGAKSHCQPQGIYLAADQYEMSVKLLTQGGAYFAGGGFDVSTIPAGRYHRECGIEQFNGPQYQVYCVLTHDDPYYVAQNIFTQEFSIPAPGGRYQIYGHYESF